jgi:hypothetical protein
MSFLNAVINKVEDADLRERLQERVDLVQHKIKFMDKIPVVCLDSSNEPVVNLEGLLSDAGGVLEVDPALARVLIYCEKGDGMVHLMGAVPPLLNSEWPAVQYSRVYLWDDVAAVEHDPLLAVNALEDLAELLYPGYFVFGNEGKTWINFKTQ